MPPPDALVSVREVVKSYQALRPLRIQSLDLQRGEVKSLIGLDAQAAEVMVGLLTGALLPDAGDVSLFGRSTQTVTDSEAWLAMLDNVGIVTDRAVLIAQFTVEQNIAMPFTLDVDPVAADVVPAVHALAAEVGLTSDFLRTRVGETSGEVTARVRLARALALKPSLLLAEHPSAALPRTAVSGFAADLRRVAASRRLAVLAITADADFARALGGEMLTHEPATGALRAAGIWRKLFG
jgi:ABC-type transporter Mla maintaining outer membrane lipid asymmetry ATPase subunit MlaF